MKIQFYLSRNPNSNTIYITSYEPKRNPIYDRFECHDGTILDQMKVGTWYYWPDHSRPCYSQCFRLKDLEQFKLKESDIPPGTCLNLWTGKLITLKEAKSIK